MPCTLCPRTCGIDRTVAKGFCGAPHELQVASVCIHRGEEPPLNPIINIFFPHCNLHCIYCQNWQISNAENITWETASIDTIADQIAEMLKHSNTSLVGFVTAAHYADNIPAILNSLLSRNIHPTVVYNSSGYESVDTLRQLEGIVDIYLPDFKYMDPDLAARYSHAPDYPEVATAALCEMIRQVGTGLKVDDSGTAYRGLIVRHLVLPGHTDNSTQVLDKLSTLNYQFSTFTSLHLSLMAQYYPPRPDLPAPLDRCLTPEEYNLVVDHAVELGLTAGWIQEINATSNYRPDFSKSNPFE